MASTSGVQQSQQQQQQIYREQQQQSPHQCKECGLYMNSAESLEVHLQYHKENLLKNWAIQAASHSSEETNNNTTKKRGEYDESKKSPTPENIFGHPPTPQSYQSASSPYQSQEATTFSPNYHQTYQVKTERSSPGHYQSYQQGGFQEQQFFIDSQYGQQQQDYQKSYRYHPYGQVSSSSPAYPPQPTPSPSPKQCDKCGYVCESAAQLIEHQNMAHPPTPMAYHNNQFMFGEQAVKTEESEILDLDSQKVVHQVYPEEDKRPNGDNPHSVTAMLNSWVPQQQQQQRMFMQQPQQQHHQQQQQQQQQEYMNNGVSTTSPDTSAGLASSQPYRPFEQPQPPVISTTQAPPAIPSTKSSNWKSNEARRPKTYNCTACNKWFTSSGHLKRHYNTTLHKNAVKSSGQPDPATLPISAHHHPARDAASNREDQQSNSPGEEMRGEDTNSHPLPGLLQQPPNGPYDRPPAPNIHHTPPLHSPMHPQMLNPGLATNLQNGSPPNGEAGLSPTTTSNIDSRGLLSSSTLTNNGFSMGVPPPQHIMPMESPQYQMYPNESAPHVTQQEAMVISSLSTTGDFHQHQQQYEDINEQQQPLPSFAHLQSQRYGGLLLSYDNTNNAANVGGGGTATAPYTTYYTTTNINGNSPSYDDYKLTILTAADPPIIQEDYTTNFNNNNLLTILDSQPSSPEKAHTKRDYEEQPPQITSTSTITKNGLHKCIDCDKVFNKACYLTQHNKTFHSGDKPFKCTRCGKRFSCEITYQEHLSKHAGEKPHKCELCPKQFNHKTDLRRHMCLHTGQKPYACDTCGKGFIRKDHMMKHCETHIRKTQSKIAAMR